MLRLSFIAAVLSLLACQSTVPPSSRSVSSLDQLARALAKSRPGSVIEVAPGDYELAGVLVLHGRGTETLPVTVRAEKIGAVRLVGNGAVQIRDSDWLVFEGFELAHAAHTLDVVDSNHVRLTRLRMAHTRSKSVDEGRYVPWIRFRSGVGHRVDHSELGPHPGGLGVTLLFENATSGARIDHNHFHNRPRDGRNGAETIRLGAGGGARLDAVVEDNLFENCDGEGEIISIKSNGITVRGNTFRNNRGQLVVRAGDDIIIERNQFIADQSDKPVGGVRVHGSNIKVLDNYFQDMSLPIIASGEGRYRSPARDTGAFSGLLENEAGGYWQAVAIVFAGNLVVDSQAAASPDARARSQPVIQLRLPNRQRAPGADLPPAEWRIADNVFVTEGPLIDDGIAVDFEWRGNALLNSSGNARGARDVPALEFGKSPAALVRWSGVWRAAAAVGSDTPTARPIRHSPGGAMLPAPLRADDVGPMSHLER